MRLSITNYFRPYHYEIVYSVPSVNKGTLDKLLIFSELEQENKRNRQVKTIPLSIRGNIVRLSVPSGQSVANYLHIIFCLEHFEPASTTMLPTSTSNKSFAQQKRNPTGRKPPIARSNSLLGTIKNIVTAPLAWFTHDDDDFEDTKGKRRRLEQNGDVGATAESGGSRNKRMRVNGPEREDQPYLDPPEQIFQQPHSAPSGSGFNVVPPRSHYPAPISRSTSMMTPSNVHRQSRNNRHTVSPLRTSFTQADAISRTMSMDPPTLQSHTRDITMTPYRDGNRYSMSVPRDVSMSPTRTQFLMRTSLTPQPSGSSFGPTLQRHRQHHEKVSEPPSIEELMAKPQFVRPPPELSHQRNLSREPVITLGSLVDSQRSVSFMTVTFE